MSLLAALCDASTEVQNDEDIFKLKA